MALSTVPRLPDVIVYKAALSFVGDTAHVVHWVVHWLAASMAVQESAIIPLFSSPSQP